MFYFFILIVLYFLLVLQHNSLHFILNKVKCEKQILPSLGFDYGGKYFQGILILASVLFLPAMQDVESSNPTEGKIYLFFHILLYLEWNVKNCFCKINIKHKTY